jgi:hypothetical protein
MGVTMNRNRRERAGLACAAALWLAAAAAVAPAAQDAQDAAAPDESKPSAAGQDDPRGPSKPNPLDERKPNPLDEPADPFVGVFTDGKLTLTLSAGPGDGQFAGRIDKGANTFNVDAKRAGDALEGHFTFNGDQYAVHGVFEGAKLILKTGSTTYRLDRQQPNSSVNPLVMPARPSDRPDKPATPGLPRVVAGGGDTKPAPAPALELPRMTSATHPSGFVARYPAAWGGKNVGEGFRLIPPDVESAPNQGPLEVLLLGRNDAGGSTKPDDPRTIDFFDRLIGKLYPNVKRDAAVEQASALAGSGVVLSYRGEVKAGIPALVRVYVMLDGTDRVYLLHAGRPDLVEKRSGLARHIFRSFGWRDEQPDPKLIGRWARVEASEAGSAGGAAAGAAPPGPPIQATSSWRFEGDKNCTYSVTGPSGTVERRGAWAICGGKLFITWNDYSGGAMFSYTIGRGAQGDTVLTLEADGQRTPFYKR